MSVGGDADAVAEREDLPSAIVGSIAHVLAALPLTLLALGGLLGETRRSMDFAHVRPPPITVALLAIGDHGIAAITVAIAALGAGSCWFTVRTSGFIVPFAVFAVQVWWAIAVLLAWHLPYVKMFELLGQ